MSTDMRDLILAPAIEDEATLKRALLRALGLDKASVEIQELTFAIATRYGLDPMLRHIVIIDGRPFVTRDGLIDIAHRSGQFDGIEVTEPWVDGGYIRARCTVWRKDMGHPVVYTGRYPKAGGNQKYNEEMAIKVSESMALRRAFRVAAPIVEEKWDTPDAVLVEDDPNAPTGAESLKQIIARQEAAVTENTSTVAAEMAVTTATPSVTIVLNPEEVAEGAEPMLADLAPDPAAAALPLCEWKLERKGGERIDCLNLAGHTEDHSWQTLAMTGGGKVVRPEA